jgi:hypothetical protein
MLIAAILALFLLAFMFPSPKAKGKEGCTRYFGWGSDPDGSAHCMNEEAALPSNMGGVAPQGPLNVTAGQPVTFAINWLEWHDGLTDWAIYIGTISGTVSYPPYNVSYPRLVNTTLLASWRNEITHFGDPPTVTGPYVDNASYVPIGTLSDYNPKILPNLDSTPFEAATAFVLVKSNVTVTIPASLAGTYTIRFISASSHGQIFPPDSNDVCVFGNPLITLWGWSQEQDPNGYPWGEFVDITTVVAPTDNKPPTIEIIQQPTLTFNEDILFNATVEDSSGIEWVQLHYSVNDGSWNNQTMQWDSGDTFNSTSYTSTIPHVPDNSVVEYYVAAADQFGNYAQSDTETVTIQYDLALLEVKTSKTVVGQGYTTRINVTVANQGSIPNTSLKTFIYANTTLIHTWIIPSLTNGTSTTLTFYWNTTDIPKGNYTITAHVVPLLDETDTIDNTFIGKTVLVTLPGDVNGNSKVDGKDIAIICKYFDSISDYPPNADITDDGKVDGRDIAIVAKHFGERYP